MKIALPVLVLLAAMTSGCMTSKVSPAFDLSSELTITLHDKGKSFATSEEDQAALHAILRFWLPKMRTAFTTYPTPTHRLGVSGKDKEGNRYEGVIFVGVNWIGDGRGVVTLADTEVFKLHRIIDRVTANQPPEPTSGLAPGHGSS